jgi:hypothetical protein
MDRLKLATVWLAGCSGCHMSFLDIDERLIDLAGKADLVYSPLVDVKEFPENVDIALVDLNVAPGEHAQTHEKGKGLSAKSWLAGCALTQKAAPLDEGSKRKSQALIPCRITPEPAPNQGCAAYAAIWQRQKSPHPPSGNEGSRKEDWPWMPRPQRNRNLGLVAVATATTVASATVSAASAATTAATARALFARPGEINGQGTSIQLFAIQSINGLLRFFGRTHGHKGKPPGPTCSPVHHQVGLHDGAVRGKCVLKIVFCRVKGEIPHE